MDLNWLEWSALAAAAIIALYLAYTLVLGERL